MGAFDSLLDQCNDFSLKVLLKKISVYQEYFHLMHADQDSYADFLQIAPKIPEQVKSWYRLFNGGYLFDTAFLSTERADWGVPIKLVSFSLVNDPETRKDMELPAGYTVFAIASFGDVYCFANNGSNEIVQWSLQEHAIVGKWANFALWLSQEIGTAIELIGEDVLTPFSI